MMKKEAYFTQYVADNNLQFRHFNYIENNLLSSVTHGGLGIHQRITINRKVKRVRRIDQRILQ